MSKIVTTKLTAATAVLLFLTSGGLFRAHALSDVTQPGDTIIASSANSPGSEGVANVIDNKPTKYLNFDTDFDAAGGSKPSGFVVTPSVGATRVVGLSMQSANDAQDRDPKIVTLEGSNDDEITSFGSGTWELIVRIDDIPSWPNVFGDAHRFKTQVFEFNNFKAYKHYRWTVLNTQGPSTCCMQIAEVELLGSVLPGDITQPGDAIIASSANSPGSEGVANVIDNKPTKYLNFDTDADAAGGSKPSGFVVTPSIGRTVVTGITMQSANDAADRDPKVVTLEGSNDEEITAFNSGSWERIVELDNIPGWATVFGTDNRFKVQTFLFDNFKPYKHYRWTVVQTQGPSTCCMQIAEVELLGTGAPQDVTQPGDAIIASSANSPGSEGVANVIDNKPTKYLNFDTDADAAGGSKPSGFVVTPSIGETTVIGMTMQSANDAQDRDPKVVTLEGSNDDQITAFNSGTWELIVRLENITSWPAVFGDAHRFKTQEFYFSNTKSYKHYRWTVVETQGPSTCCMQIAEVELLAASAGADCNKARFLVQPVVTPTLEGQAATFMTLVNGPWPLQWYRNGQPIPGANQASYTTGAVNAQNVADVYSVQIVGCEMSSEVTASIFRPSTIKSIGVNFDGGGANGAPTAMLQTDIAGIHPQAYWNNATVGSGSLPDYLSEDPRAYEVYNSDNQPTQVFIEWTSSGEWGAGTGNASPTQRMLNGMVYDSVGGEPGRIQFHTLPDGNHSVIVYLVGIPLQFRNSDYKVIGQTEQTVHVRVINADEYNAAPGFYRGISTDPNEPSLATYVRFDNVRPAGGTITLEWSCLTAGFDQGTPVNAVQILLNAPAPGAPPVISSQPQPTAVPAGGTARISVGATGGDLTYQWLKNGRNLPNGGNISGATTGTLTISSFSEADEAIYSVAVFNPGGSTISKNASVRLSQFRIDEALVGYWKFDDNSGATAANAVQGGRPGTINGPASWATGQIAGALGFNGTSTHAVVDNYTKATKALSGSAWVKVNPGVSSTVIFMRNGQGNLRRSTDSSPAPSGQFEIGLNYNEAANAAYLSAAIQVGPNIPRATATSNFPVGTWQHVAFSADGAQLRLYHNGVQVASADYLGNINPPDISYLTIGAQLNIDPDTETLGPDVANPKFLSGQLDDLALWARALSATEVARIYAAGNQGQAVTTVTIEPPTSEDVEVSVAISGANIVISWPAGSAGFVLESTDAIVPASWTAVTGVNGNSYTVAPAGTAKFYRLRKQ
jgi:hypothetical protein